MSNCRLDSGYQHSAKYPDQMSINPSDHGWGESPSSSSSNPGRGSYEGRGDRWGVATVGMDGLISRCPYGLMIGGRVSNGGPRPRGRGLAEEATMDHIVLKVLKVGGKRVRALVVRKDGAG